MTAPTSASLFLADCPARLTVELIGEKWSVPVLAGLSSGPRRHGELQAAVGDISRKMLTQTLRRLEAHGLVLRRELSASPPRAEYALTPLGESLMPAILLLSEWARENGDAVLEALEGQAELASA